MTAKKSVLINWKEYTLDSDNKDLLRKMPPVSVKNKQTGKWEQVEYPYIPIGIIKTLLDNLTDSYDVHDDGAKYEEEFHTEKKDKNGETVKNHLRMYSYSITYTINLDGVTTMLKGYCRGVASINVLCNDGSANGFFQKLSARATKSALKNFAKVFRMDDEADDVIDWESSPISDETSETKEIPYSPKPTEEKSKKSSKSNDTVNAVMDDISKSEQASDESGNADEKKASVVQDTTEQDKNAEIEKSYQKRFNALVTAKWTTESELWALVKAIKKEDNITSKSDPRVDILRKVYNISVEALKTFNENAENAPEKKPAKKTATKKETAKAEEPKKAEDDDFLEEAKKEKSEVLSDQERYDAMFLEFVEQDWATVESLREFCKKIKKDENIPEWDPRLDMIKKLWVDAKATIEAQSDDWI